MQPTDESSLQNTNTDVSSKVKQLNATKLKI